MEKKIKPEKPPEKKFVNPTSKAYMEKMGPFDITGAYDDIPMARQVIHRQSIAIQRKAHFEIELSFEGLKFYIIVKRRFFNPKQLKSMQEEMRNKNEEMTKE